MHVYLPQNPNCVHAFPGFYPLPLPFISNLSPVNSFAAFRVMYTCTSDTPYKYTIVAFDDDCLKKDTAYLNIEVYVLPEFVAAENICGVTVDTILQKNFVFWKRTNSNVSSYTIFKENSLTAQFDSIARISASNLNGFVDSNSNSGYQSEKYKIIAIDGCGTKSLQSGVSSSIYLTSTQIRDDKMLLTWTPYPNASLSDSFIVSVSNCRPNKEFEEIARIPITQLNYLDSQMFICQRIKEVV